METTTSEYAAFTRRILAALARRIETGGDVESLSDLATLAADVEAATAAAIVQLRAEYGYSWSDVGRAMGVTKQAVQQRFGPYSTDGATNGGGADDQSGGESPAPFASAVEGTGA